MLISQSFTLFVCYVWLLSMTGKQRELIREYLNCIKGRILYNALRSSQLGGLANEATSSIYTYLWRCKTFEGSLQIKRILECSTVYMYMQNYHRRL